MIVSLLHSTPYGAGSVTGLSRLIPFLPGDAGTSTSGRGQMADDAMGGDGGATSTTPENGGGDNALLANIKVGLRGL